MVFSEDSCFPSISFVSLRKLCFSFKKAVLLPIFGSLYLNVRFFNFVKVAAASDFDLSLDGGGVPTGAPSKYVTSFPNEILDDLTSFGDFAELFDSSCCLDLLLATLLQLEEQLDPAV